MATASSAPSANSAAAVESLEPFSTETRRLADGQAAALVARSYDLNDEHEESNVTSEASINGSEGSNNGRKDVETGRGDSGGVHDSIKAIINDDDVSLPFGPLPEQKNIDGRPVWEPPVLAYNALIGEEFDKRREAALKYTGGDAVRTTEILDASIEMEAMTEYLFWVLENLEACTDSSEAVFWRRLSDEVQGEWWDNIERYSELDLFMYRKRDGTVKIVNESERSHSGWSDYRLGSDVDVSRDAEGAVADDEVASTPDTQERILLELAGTTQPTDDNHPGTNTLELNFPDSGSTSQPIDEDADPDSVAEYTPPLDLLSLWW